MKIAFASKDVVYINQHFGWCETFYIYSIFEESFALIQTVDSSIKHDNEIDKLEYKIECLDGSDIVISSQIGPKAANMVKMAGIYPMKSSNENGINPQGEEQKIEDSIASIQKLMSNNPPLWLKRIILKYNR